MHGRLREEGGVLRYVDGNNFPGLFSPGLLADAEFPNDRLVALGIVSLEIVQ